MTSPEVPFNTPYDRRYRTMKKLLAALTAALFTVGVYAADKPAADPNAPAAAAPMKKAKKAKKHKAAKPAAAAASGAK